MAKRFAYVSFGLLCLVAAYQLGAGRARADWNVTGTIVGGDFRTYFAANGEAWTLNEGSRAWERNPTEDLPVPASNVKFFSQSGWIGGYGYLVTTSDEGWVKGGGPAPWEYVGQLPGPVALPSEFWGRTSQESRGRVTGWRRVHPQRSSRRGKRRRSRAVC
jgi:hypothetical protein